MYVVKCTPFWLGLGWEVYEFLTFEKEESVSTAGLIKSISL